MKKSLLTLIALLVTASMFAVPAHPRKRTATQPDGTTVQYQLIGDEIYHYAISENGKLMERNAEGFLVETGDAPTETQVRARRAASPRRRAIQPRKVGSSSFAHRGLVILVEFLDTKFQKGNTKAAFEEMLNGDNYTYNGATGSVKKYYQDQSDNAFTPTFDVYGPVSLTRAATWYGANDLRVGNMVSEAINELIQSDSLDITQYDADNDGYVDFVDILYAGYGAADSDYSSTVWPCEWDLVSAGRSQITYNGKIFNTFSCHQERDGATGQRAGIGTPCHEFGHVFGLPDFYDTTYKNATLGNWDLMDGGAYNNNCNTPPGFSGYERMFAGWAKPRLLTSPENVTLHELQSSQEVLVVSTTGNHNMDATNPSPTTFYLLENRQQTGWDTYLPGHGMLIWKIQYSAAKWLNNTVNNASVSKQGVAIQAADGRVYYELYNGSVYTYGDSGDTYPGTSNVTKYESINNYPITDIAENAGLINFKFMGGATIPFTVTFNAGDHGSCSTTSLTETAAGAGILLPAVTANADYMFIGWSTTADGINADAGKTGDTYKPTKDITLYALYSPLTCSVEWETEHVTVSPMATSIGANETLTATITAEEGYEFNKYDIAISMGGHDLTEGTDYSFAEGTLSIPDVRGNLTITVIAREEGQARPCDDYSYVFMSNPTTGINMLDGYEWNISLQSGTIQTYDPDRGAHFGSKTTPSNLISLKSSETADCAIESVVVNAARTSTNGNGIPTISIYIGNDQLGTIQALNTAATEHTFQNNINARGDIEIRLVSTNAGVYVKSINIKYDKSIASTTDNIIGLPFSLSGNHLTIESNHNLFTISGLMLGNRQDYYLTPGIYVLQTESNTYKIIIH